jgi:hypothetical protein
MGLAGHQQQLAVSWDQLDTSSKGAGKTDADSAQSKPASGRKLRFTV